MQKLAARAAISDRGSDLRSRQRSPIAAAISDCGLQGGIKLKQIRICLLEEIESFLHVMPPLLKGDRLSHTLYVANSSFQANQRVCAVLPKQQQKNPHDFFFQKGEQKKQTLFKPRDRALHTLRRLCCPRVWQIVMMCGMWGWRLSQKVRTWASSIHSRA
jgi:hypothetical protein